MNHAVQTLKKFVGKELTESPSPYTHWLRPILLHVEEGNLSCRFKVSKEWTNPMATLHGGVTASIMDDVIGAAIYSMGEESFYTTVNLVVDYFSSARENDVIVAHAVVIKKGRQIMNAQCELWNADKTKMIARGYSNLLNTNIKK